MGSHDNVSEYQPGAKVFQVKDGALVEYASGIRNPVGIAFYPGTHDLFVAANERDGLGDNLPPDYFTYVKPGGFYGYPWSYTGKLPDPDLGAKRPDMVAKAITPDVLFPAHSAPTGLVFYTGDSFPADYKGDAFVSLHARGTPASRTATRWCAFTSRMAGRRMAALRISSPASGTAKPRTRPWPGAARWGWLS
jgi:glucose/arabinose dehydrogenase